MNLLSDLRFAARLLVKDPWFTAVAALTLALGIGANSTVFTLVNAVLIRGLPFEQADRIMQLSTRDARDRARGVSYLDYKDWATSTRAFGALAVMNGATMNVSDEGRAPERYQGQFISHSLFGLIGARPALGREFSPEDDRLGGEAVVLLSSGVWRNRYGGDPSILGKIIRINNIPSVVIGVMPEGFRFPNNAELWQPFAMVQDLAGQKRDARFFNVIGRLAPQATIEQARSDLGTITSRLAGEYPDTNKDIRPFVERYTAGTGGPIRLMFLSLMGAVAFVLLIACANVANLLLARAAERTREISVRMSLGASRWQVVRQLLVESLMLATIGGVIGFGLSVVGVRLFDAAVSDPRLGKPYWIEFTMDWRVVGFFAAVCLATAIAFGLAPALHVSKTNVNEVLKEGGRGSGGTRRARRWTSVLLVVELALTLVLLAGAGFMMRSFLNMYRLDLGVTTAGVTTMRLQLPNQKYPTPETRLAFYQRLEERLGAINSIPFVTVANNVPMGGGGLRLLAIEGRAAAAGETLPTIVAMLTGRTYFDLFDLPVRGRGFTDTDGAAGQDVAIVNERLASMQFPGEDPIGRRIRLTIPDDTSTPPTPWLTIVGVTKNVRQRNPQNNPDPDPIVYRPFRADPIGGMALIVRTQGDPAAATALLREEVRALDADLPLFNIDTLDSILAVQRWFYRIFGLMFAIFAGIALVLSAVGLYAVTSYSVTQRTQEIGVRMALGAQQGQVLWLFLKQAVVKLAIGLAIGLAGAFGVGILLRSFLVQTGTRDPITLVSIAVMLAIVSLAACYWPARRATRLDPVSALRYE